MEVAGKIKFKSDHIQVSDNFVKAELVVTTNEQYPQDIKIEFHQDKCDLIDQFNAGEEVEVSINLRGREWVNPKGESIYFNTIVGWRIARPDTSKHPQPAAKPADKPAAQKPAAATQTNPQQMGGPLPGEEEEDDDLPF